MDIRKTWLFSTPIAHRGLHTNELPENSIGAFLNGASQGFPIELDVRLSDDGEVMVIHDDKLSRMSGNDGYVASQAASDLKKIKLKNILGEDTEYYIPTLSEVFEAIGGKTPILIETKTSQTNCGALESKVLEIIRSYKGEVAVQSFSPYSLEYFKTNAFEIPRGQLSKFFQKSDLDGLLKRTLLKKLRMNHVSKPDFNSYEFENLPNKWVLKTKLPVLAWTIRSNTDLESVKQYCDNIIFENFLPQMD
jgi:glycerophosphoryl diester phosphodiesterase